MKPNFFIIGAARSGTTSLYLYLEQHPEIYFSDVKELNFFSNPRYWAKGLKWYESRFNPRSQSITRIGEASTSYTRAPFTEETPKRIADYAPEAKLIYIVRNPMQRFVSHYLHRVQAGQETREISEIIENLENEAFAWQGLYNYQVEEFQKYFKPSQILVISMDDLKTSPRSLISKVFQFLGVSEDFEAEKSGTIFNANRVTTKKSRVGMAILSFYRKNLLQRPIPYQIKRAIQFIGEIGSTVLDEPSLSDRNYDILKKFYRKDSQKLQDNYGINTKHWFE
ncbi:MAG: sulfotransferase family protein [Marinobacter sp.]